MRDYNVFFPPIKAIKSKKKKLAQTSFYCFVEKNDWMIHENLFKLTNQDSAVSLTWENSKMFNITSKYFSILNNKPRAS